ncbi:PREDICTED: ARGOS-like protein [Ipomoea nil]|uniref:ARGOS-like protein n=1 Tax=Ipomoea nil TaxID=35883 RepID=UPI000901B906|nr:PREDICTED: ARGOS-like protein [Ipomoea nil]
MIVETTQEKAAASKTYINLEQQRQYLNSVMDMKTKKATAAIPRKNGVPFAEAKKVEYRRSLSQGPGKRMFSMSYFSLESFLLLIGLTASLLLLPLILPPLPPPPLMLLLVPICILVVLMMLAFTPSKVRDMTYTYV